MAAPGFRAGAMGSAKRFGDDLVRQQDEDYVIPAGLGEGHHLEVLPASLLGVLVVYVTDADVDAGVAQVQSRGAAEIAVAEDGDPLSFQRRAGSIVGAVETLVGVGHGARR